MLPGWYDDWAVIGRERVRQRVMHALEALSRHLVACRRLVEAVEVARAAVAAEPLRESAQRVLVEALLALGNRAEAAQVFLHFQAQLARDLGVEPSPELRGLVSGHLRSAVRWQPAYVPDDTPFAALR
jgi:DNA-binding SARP family transcriptional activator